VNLGLEFLVTARRKQKTPQFPLLNSPHRAQPEAENPISTWTRRFSVCGSHQQPWRHGRTPSSWQTLRRWKQKMGAAFTAVHDSWIRCRFLWNLRCEIMTLAHRGGGGHSPNAYRMASNTGEVIVRPQNGDKGKDGHCGLINYPLPLGASPRCTPYGGENISIQCAVSAWPRFVLVPDRDKLI